MRILIGLLLAAAPMATDEQNAKIRARQLIRLTPWLSAVDLNKDGSGSAEEMLQALASMRAMDRNGEGMLQPEERAFSTAAPFQPAVHVEDEKQRGDRGSEETDRRTNSDEQHDHPERDGRRSEQSSPRSDRNAREGGRDGNPRPDGDRGPDQNRPRQGEIQNGHRPEGDRRHSPEVHGGEARVDGPDTHRDHDENRRDDGVHRDGRGGPSNSHDGRGPDRGQAEPREQGSPWSDDRDGQHHGPSNETRPGFGPGPAFGLGRGRGPGVGPEHGPGPGFGMGGGSGRGPQMMRHFGPMAQNIRKDGDQHPQMQHRPNVPPVVAQQHQPHPTPGMKLQPDSHSMAITGILFRLLDSDHNGSLSPGEFQRISGALSGPAGPSAWPQTPTHSAGPRLMPRPQMTRKPEGPPGSTNRGPDTDRRPEPRPNPEGHRQRENMNSKSDAQEKPGDHPKLGEPRPENGPDRPERRRRRESVGRDQARPTEASQTPADSEWI